jgi:Holliday junction resolvase RusA-like endonuclease
MHHPVLSDTLLEHQMRSEDFERLMADATLPLPPGINASYKTVTFKTKDGRLVQRPGATPELEAFKQSAHFALLERGINWPLIHMVQSSKTKIPLAVTIDFYFPTLWKRDIDGGEKAAIDAVFNYIGLNDNLIVDKHTRKFVDRDHPRCEVSLSIAEAEG